MVIFVVVLISTVAVQIASTQSQPEDSLRTTSVWKFFPNQAVGAGDQGFGMISLFAGATETPVGGINFYCVVTRGYPYLDIYAYKQQPTIQADDQERRWLPLTAQTILRVGNVSLPISIEGGFIYIDINPPTEYLIRRIFDIQTDTSSGQAVERILEVPGFVKLKLLFQPGQANTNERDELSISFAEMLDMCNAARKSVATKPKNTPRR
jgi:hypothetical protein